MTGRHKPVRLHHLRQGPGAGASTRLYCAGGSLRRWCGRLRRAAPLWLAAWLAALASPVGAADLRVGVLEFGTVQWTLEVVEHHRLAERRGLDLKILPLGSKNAVAVALQGGAVDVIVTDWIWVSRQRAAGRPYTFVPYSVATGAVMVRPDAGASGLGDLRGKPFGVAGGPLDKSWLLLRAYARRTLGEDMADVVRPAYAAPPLLNELMLRGDLPAVLNFWHYSARLQAAGMRSLISVDEVVKGLGITEPIPAFGWVFDENWAQTNRDSLRAFLAAVDEASAMLRDSDQEWQRLQPLVKAENARTLAALRDAYRAGIADPDGRYAQAAGRAFAILAAEGGAELVGDSARLSPGTFWSDQALIGRSDDRDLR